LQLLVSLQSVLAVVVCVLAELLLFVSLQSEIAATSLHCLYNLSVGLLGSTAHSCNSLREGQRGAHVQL